MSFKYPNTFNHDFTIFFFQIIFLGGLKVNCFGRLEKPDEKGNEEMKPGSLELFYFHGKSRYQ